MTNQSVARRLLAEMVSRKEEEIELARAALLFAKEEYPGLDVGKYLQKLELMTEEIKSRIGNNNDPHFLISEINRYLFTEEGFRGNEDDYYDPRNSFLNDVLDIKTGIPITLSVLYIEIASRLGLTLLGVGFPGHFIVKYSGMEGEILVDPFNKGRILSIKDCKEILDRIYGGRMQFHSEFLQPVTKKEILSRMLHNLTSIYLNTTNYLTDFSFKPFCRARGKVYNANSEI